MLHRLEQVNRQESKFKHIKLKNLCGVHVSRTSGVSGDQLF